MLSSSANRPGNTASDASFSLFALKNQELIKEPEEKKFACTHYNRDATSSLSSYL